MGKSEKTAGIILLVVVILIIALVAYLAFTQKEPFEKGSLVLDLSVDKLKEDVKKDLDAIGVKVKK